MTSKEKNSETMISHIIFNRRTGDIYISVPRSTELYRQLTVMVARNGSAKGIRVVLSIKGMRIVVEKEKNE